MFEIKESSFNRCKATVVLVSGKFCMNRFLERVIICEEYETGIVMGIWAHYEDDSNEYGTGIVQIYDYRLPDNLSKELKNQIKKYLDKELEKESNVIRDLRHIRDYLKESISQIDYKIEDNIWQQSYSDGFNDGRKIENGQNN